MPNYLQLQYYGTMGKQLKVMCNDVIVGVKFP